MTLTRESPCYKPCHTYSLLSNLCCSWIDTHLVMSWQLDTQLITLVYFFFLSEIIIHSIRLHVYFIYFFTEHNSAKLEFFEAEFLYISQWRQTKVFPCETNYNMQLAWSQRSATCLATRRHLWRKTRKLMFYIFSGKQTSNLWLWMIKLAIGTFSCIILKISMWFFSYVSWF